MNKFQIPGGFLASIFPANRIFGVAIASSAFLNLLLPGALALTPYLVVLIRATQGFVEVTIAMILPIFIISVILM
jgi:ACS family sodium-dependent inorganic phosphate cotransporter-like MFS transporter 6/7/8